MSVDAICVCLELKLIFSFKGIEIVEDLEVVVETVEVAAEADPEIVKGTAKKKKNVNWNANKNGKGPLKNGL